jgi:hypothetical protein
VARFVAKLSSLTPLTPLTSLTPKKKESVNKIKGEANYSA